MAARSASRLGDPPVRPRAASCSILALADIIIEAIPIGLFFGRIANFINGELYGRETDVPWAMVFPGGGPVPRHPSQLYEAACEGCSSVPLAVRCRASRRAAAAGARDRPLSRRLCGGAHVRRAVPPARRAARLLFSIGQFGTTMGQLLSIPVLIAGALFHLVRLATARRPPRRGDERPRPCRTGSLRHIRAHGPLTIAAFMAMALHDPEAGYYARRNPLGAAGDFVTAPEISQIFGELIGLWCADLWQRMGSPDPVILAELGPGRGTLMADFLRATRRVAGFREALRLHLVEASPVLRETQRHSLKDIEPVWVSSFDEVPDGPLLLVANEFLDALPIRQLVRGRAHWAERMVAVDRERTAWLSPTGRKARRLSLLVPPARRDAAPGDDRRNLPGRGDAGRRARRAARPPARRGAVHRLRLRRGIAGRHAGRDQRASWRRCPRPAWRSGSLRACRFRRLRRGGARRRRRGPRPGDAARVSSPRSAPRRGSRRCCGAPIPAQRAALETGLRRLIDPQEMGTLFKVLALTSPGLPAPAGFGWGTMLTLDVLDSAAIRHAFFTREGGVSEGMFASLNCGFGSGDDPA